MIQGKGEVSVKKPIKLYIDVDNTIYNSARVVVEMLNERYGCDVNYEDIKGYDFKDKFPMLKENEVMNLFDDPTFYGRKNRDIFSENTTVFLRKHDCIFQKTRLHFSG